MKHIGDLTAEAGKVHERIGTPCRIWGGARDRKGYGLVRISGVVLRVHRLSYRIYVREIPRGMFVCHSCDNPPCMEPSHLFLGTNSENQRDSGAKGRHWQSRKTHCPSGHKYSPENTRVINGSRFCRACGRNRQRIRRARGAGEFANFFKTEVAA